VTDGLTDRHKQRLLGSECQAVGANINYIVCIEIRTVWS